MGVSLMGHVFDVVLVGVPGVLVGVPVEVGGRVVGVPLSGCDVPVNS